jgi:peptidylprolyl isomerase
LKTKDFWTRFFMIFIVFLFVVTSLGVGVYGFWQATQQSKKTPDVSTTPPPPTDTCTFDVAIKAAALSKPEAYKPKGDVKKLETTDLKVGTGAEAKSGDCLVMKYYGTLASSGEMFDQNYDKDTGLKFRLGIGNVIKGWDQGLVGMKEGGTRRLVIPSDLAYGEQAQGAIPANADLVFEVHLSSIE